VVLGILISVIGILFSVTHFLVWCFMALGTLSILVWLSCFVDSSSLCVYFLSSVLGGLLFLLSSIECWASHILLQCAVTLKLGLAPFHFWVFNLLRYLPPPTLCLFLGPAKVGLLRLLVSFKSISLSLAAFSLVLGLTWLWLSNSLCLILYSSGSCQFIIYILLGTQHFSIYFLIYSLSLFAVQSIHFAYISPVLAFLCLAGLPPLTMFSAKLLALTFLPLASGILLLLISIFSFLPYLAFSLSMRSSHSSSPLLVTLLIVLPFCVVYTYL